MIAELRTRLGDELERLSAELDGRMSIAPGEDAGALVGAVGAEAEAARRRMATLGRLVAGLEMLDAAEIPADRAGFGSVVRVRDVATGDESVYTLMTGDLVDPDAGHVSLASPIGHALLGRAPGERVSVATPRGVRRFELLSLVTLPQRAGLGSAPGRAARVA